MKSKQIQTGLTAYAAEQTKHLVDKFSAKAKELLNDESIDEVKQLIDEIAGKSKGVNEDAGFWKSKLQEISEDGELKDKIDGFTKDADNLLNNKAVKETLDNLLSGENMGDLLKKLVQNPDEVMNENFWADKKLKDEDVIKEQVDQIKNDPNVKALLEKYSKDAEGIIRQFENILKKNKES